MLSRCLHNKTSRTPRINGVRGSKHKSNRLDYMPAKIVSDSDPRVQGYIGKRFGKLTTVRFLEVKPGGAQIWECKCDCGNTTIVFLSNIKRGITSSCGCIGGAKTHGFTSGDKRHLIYGVWCTMIQRCKNAHVKAWKNYGGRGITVCERWKTFENFIEDMLPSYKWGLTLDRVNNNGPYSPENCEWRTRSQQSLNKRTARMITFRGETLNLIVWARRLGIHHAALIARLKRWPIERALTELPVAWFYEI